MKTRNGFVSNSSSSSFILNTKNINSVASYMLDLVIREFGSWDKDDSPVIRSKKTEREKKERLSKYRTWERNLRKAYKIKDIQSGKIGITTPSCNYETYIIKRDNSIYISTCNNHPWDFEASSIYSGGGADEDDKVHKIIEKSFFYNVRNGLIHSVEIWGGKKEIPYCSTCEEKPFNYVETMDGEMLCGKCYGGNFGKTPEKLLEELRENSKKNMSAFKYLEP